MSISLYKIASDVEVLLENGIDPDTGEMSQELGAAWSAMEDKGRAVVAYYLNKKALLGMLIRHIEEKKNDAEKILKKIDAIHTYLQDNMKRTGVTSIESNDGTFSAKLYLDRDESLDVYDASLLPMAYMTTPKIIESAPMKNEIKKALKEGKDIQGARIVKKDRLIIK